MSERPQKCFSSGKLPVEPNEGKIANICVNKDYVSSFNVCNAIQTGQS